MPEEETGKRGRSGMGPAGNCVCPQCGYKVPHQPGKPYRELKCPQCGVGMLREGSPCQT